MKRASIISDEAKAVNFREVCMGSIAPNTLYRSSHPIKDNQQEKALSLLASKARIAAVLNLCDTNSEIVSKAIFSPWYNKLLKNNQVIALGWGFNCTSENFKKKFKKGLQFIINTEGPWLIHCFAGVDRTGFISMVLEAFMGATLDEINNDYLLSFNSHYDSAIFGVVNKTDSQVVMQLQSAMSDSQAINDQNLQQVAESYLREKISLSAEELELLRNKLSVRPCPD
ncbi:MAG: tyrosine-protein phosphatase [Treponema sp.]|jgi:protein tyrosine phosphatase|nr:tyrosine-protein phosphatase [Treponema sp.]